MIPLKSLNLLNFKMFKIIFATFSLLILASLVHAGTIKGEVKYSGKAPSPVTHNTGKFAKVCGPQISDESLILENQKVKNVVVWLEGKQAKKLKSKPGTFTIDQKKCTYSPHVLAMPQGSELKILTSDPINHNIHTYSFENDPINIMFLPGQDYTQEMEEPEVIKVSCDLHSWMVAYIVVTPHSYFSMTESDGTFEIKNVPPGKYILKIWHESLGEESRKIKVGENITQVNFDFSELANQVSKK
jgi:plastocyanin